MKHWRCAILGLWIALTCSVQAIGGIQGLVLCLSSQGHIAIESAHDGPQSCADACAPADEASSASEFIDVHVDPCCVDVSLGQIDMRIDRRSESLNDSDVETPQFLAVVESRAGPQGIQELDLDELALQQAQDAALQQRSRCIRTFILRT